MRDEGTLDDCRFLAGTEAMGGLTVDADGD